MNIRHDRTYITDNELEFVARGYRHEDLHCIRFCHVYTQEEGVRNKTLMESASPELRESILANSVRQRDAAMRPVMETLAAAFVCYQYDETLKLPFEGTGWDLYFSCNYSPVLSDGRDYSYFTLTFNSKHSPKERQEICDRVQKLLLERFAQHPNLEVAIQYTTIADENRIKQAAEAVLPALLGKPCMYRGLQGKVIQTDTGVFFKKKHARTKGYVLKAADILKISWDAV